MKVLIVYDSFFGNTEQIARVIGKALEAEASVETARVSEISPEKIARLDLLIVGSPTRGFRPTEATTNFLKSLPRNSLQGVKVAAFDTRILLDTINSSILRFVVNTGGYAAKAIAKGLKKSGGDLLAPPEGFLVTGEQGPLKEGELERAANWARQFTNA